MKYKGEQGGNEVSQILNRSLNSLILVKCSRTKADIMFKIVTLLNLAIKTGSLLSKQQLKLRNWSFEDCLVRVRFFDISYIFYCPRGFDFNIFLNPFFHEQDISTFIYRNFQKADTFIDVGAHGGLYTIITSKIANIEGRVLSIEPNSQNLKYLRANVELNKLRNVTVIPKALAEKKKTVTLSYEQERTSLTSISETTKGNRRKEIVQTATLDDIGQDLDSVKIVKIDTEGYDMNVLEGGRNILRKTKYVIVETNNNKIREFLTNLGYSVQNLEPSGYLLATNLSFK